MFVRSKLASGLLAACCAVLLLASATGRAQAPTPPASELRVYYGAPTPVGNGTVRTWVVTNRTGQPLSLGVTLSDGVYTGLPTQAEEYEYLIPLPTEVAVPPFNHFTLNWNPRGHIPAHIYDVPHFDFHFYLISPAERQQIRLSSETLPLFHQQPPAEYIPQGYILAPESEVEHMGAHWVDPNAPEFHGQPFTASFLYGFYQGRMVFLEPMVTIAYLQSRPNLCQPIAQPLRFQLRGYYPTTFAVQYDPRMGTMVALSGLALR